MTTQRRTTTFEFTCEEWAYGPQVSKKNSPYSIGGKTTLMWGKTRLDCISSASIRPPFNKLKYITIQFLKDATSVDTIKTKIDSELIDSETFETFLLIHSAFIIALGDLIQKNNDNRVLNEGYHYFYDEIKKQLEFPSNITNFVAPELFIKLDNKDTYRPYNILRGTTIQEVVRRIKIIKPDPRPEPEPGPEPGPEPEPGPGPTRRQLFTTQYPIPEQLLTCRSSLTNNDCVTKFSELEPHPFFKPIVDIMSCHCSALKQKLNKTDARTLTIDGDKSKQIEFSKGDYDYIKYTNTVLYNEVLPPIIIKKYKFEDNVCANKNYLSQLFEKCCMLFYKPTFIKPTTPDELYNAARDNLLIATKGCSGYFQSNYNLIFQSSIVHRERNLQDGIVTEDLGKYSNTPVYFITEENSRIYYDPYCGPAFQFYADVLKELMDYKVFIPINTLFSNERYVLNMNFDIDELEFYKNFPREHKTPEFKKKITHHFFRFVGNLIHFAVANNLELPFKLSRIYIMKIFSLFDFTTRSTSRGFDITNKIYYKSLLISTYFIEKLTFYSQNLYMQIFQNPELLKNPTPELLTAFNSDDGETSIHMNGFNTLTDAPDDSPEFLYKEGDTHNTVMIKLIDFLYKTAFKSYFENQTRENKPLTKDFIVNSNLQMLFEGFSTIRELDSQNALPLRTMDNTKLTFDQKLSFVRKADIYLTGFGITYDTIQKLLIPKIKFTDLEYSTMPLEFLNINKNLTIQILDEIVHKNVFTTLSQPIKKFLKKCFLLYKVLLCRGENIPIDFINAYNEKMFISSNQKVKITIIQEIKNGVEPLPIIIPEGATIIPTKIRTQVKTPIKTRDRSLRARTRSPIITKKITVIKTTSNIRISIPKDATYEYTPLSSGNKKAMTNEDYHNEFVKYLLKFWSASPNIGTSIYTMSYQSEKQNAIPTDYIIAATCFLRINTIKIYTTKKDLYEDLVKSIIHTGFGEMLGGKKKSRKRKK